MAKPKRLVVKPNSLFLLMLATSTIAGAAEDEPSHSLLQIRTQILLKLQCDEVLAGYADEISPHFSRWRAHHRLAITSLEQQEAFQAQRQAVVRYAPKMSARARAGLEKDCRKLHETLSQKQ